MLYPKLFHVTCIPHLLHNCATEVKSHYEDVDQLVAEIKLAIVKNKTRRANFAAFGCQPQSVVTRRGSCLNVALYYERIYLK